MPKIGEWGSGDKEPSFQVHEARLSGFGVGYWDIPIEVLALRLRASKFVRSNSSIIAFSHSNHDLNVIQIHHCLSRHHCVGITNLITRVS